VQALGTGAQQVKEATVETSGTVVGVNRDLLSVKLDNEAVVKATVSGRMFKHKIRVLTGDKVLVEMTPHDLTRGRIVYRSNKSPD
jgi:translation initiation factor IF-1